WPFSRRRASRPRSTCGCRCSKVLLRLELRPGAVAWQNPWATTGDPRGAQVLAGERGHFVRVQARHLDAYLRSAVHWPPVACAQPPVHTASRARSSAALPRGSVEHMTRVLM